MTVRIAACQMNSQGDKVANLKMAGQLIDEAASRGAEIIALPEYFNLLGDMQVVLAGAEPIPGPTSNFLQEKAREHRVTIHGGSMAEAIPHKQKSWFTTLVVDPHGEIIARYRKIHLFDINLAERASGNESTVADPGQEIVTYEGKHGHFGLSICYDLRFPELFRAMTLRGARVIFLPAAFTLYTGKDHWEALIRARAIENQVYMVAPAQFGTHAPGKQCYGNSMIVDPWGTVIARAPEAASVIVADIDFDYQDDLRQNLPSLNNRSPDLY